MALGTSPLVLLSVLLAIPAVGLGNPVEWVCASHEELAAPPPASRRFLSPTDTSRRARYLRQAFVEVRSDRDTCTAVAVGNGFQGCCMGEASVVIASDGSRGQLGMGSATLVPPTGFPALGPLDGATVASRRPLVAVAVWLQHGELRAADVRLIAETPTGTLVTDRLLPIGAALLDDKDRFLGSVVRHLTPMRQSVARTIPIQIDKHEPPFKALSSPRSGLSTLQARVRLVTSRRKVIGMAVVVGAATDGPAFALLSLLVSLRCERTSCELAYLDGRKAEPLLASPETSGIALWRISGSRGISLLPFEPTSHSRRSEQVAAVTPEGKTLLGRVARAEGELGAALELDFEQHVDEGVAFNLDTGRFIGFTQAVGHGEITRVQPVGPFWVSLWGHE